MVGSARRSLCVTATPVKTTLLGPSVVLMYSGTANFLYRIAGNLAGIKFGDFGQNTILFNLASFKFGYSGPQLPNVTSPL